MTESLSENQLSFNSQAYMPIEHLKELRERLDKQKKLNAFLEKQNYLLKKSNENQNIKDSLKSKLDSLANNYGTELSNDINKLITENEHLKHSLEKSYRNSTQLHNDISILVKELTVLRKELHFGKSSKDIYDEIEKKKDFWDLLEDVENMKDDIKTHSLTGEPRKEEILLNNALTKPETCLCTQKLEEIINTIDSNLDDYQSQVWQHRVGVAESERDELLAKNVLLVEQLVTLHSSINKDPFLSGKSKLAINNQSNQNDFSSRLVSAYKELSISQELNIELERRLSFEQNISRSWQVNLRALQHELRDHFDDLAKVSKLTGPFCTLFLGELNASSSGIKCSPSSITRTERESVSMLQKARDRIEADKQRINVHTHRIKELEEEVANLRVRLNSISKQRL